MESESTNSSDTVLGPEANSSRFFFPGEKLEMGEMRVTLIGTGWGNVVGPTQKGPSIYVELGNENEDSFVFDVGPGCILNYNAMEIPMSKMNHIFLSHLHMDHCSDLPFIYSFGPNLGDRYKPLNIYGPSGPDWVPTDADPTEGQSLGTKNMVEGMKQFTRWHTTSFATMTSGADESYALKDSVHEFDYQLCGGIAFENDEVKIYHFPAVHIIDGAVSYRIVWTPKGADKPIVLVYSGDTQPNDFMIQYGEGADLMIHETAPSVDSIMDSAGSSEDEALAIVCNSHTPAESLGWIFSETEPVLGVTTHTSMDPRFVDAMISGVRSSWDGPYQIGADLMVFNVGQDENGDTSIRTRMAAPVDRPWPIRIEEAPTTTPPLDPSDYRSDEIFDKAELSDACQIYIDDQP